VRHFRVNRTRVAHTGPHHWLVQQSPLKAPARVAFALGVLALATTRAQAQSLTNDSAAVASPDSTASARRATADSTPPWITKRELLGGGVSVLATIAVAPFDKPVSAELQEAGWQKDEPLHSASQVLAFAGGPGPFLVGAGLFAAGHLAGNPGLYGAGAHVTEAVLLAASVTALGKGIAGRALPGVKTSESFEWARGFHRGNGPFVSFPSGHTAAAFAMASALTGETAACSPGLARYVGPFAYATASAIGFARLYQHVHWVSDLPLAAAIGTWSGISVESHVHRHRKRDALERVVQYATLQPSPEGGVSVGLSLPFVAQVR
jgi:membrane-associated phospholipid phosphatase